jgi:tRNA G18 (ribose-2'-O)-methylase SpoU
VTGRSAVLYRVGRNLNRAYRTCEAFGVQRLQLVECGGVLAGNLFKAKGRVHVTTLPQIPTGATVLALETWAAASIHDIDLALFHTLILGNETKGLPRGLPITYACIPMVGNVSGLTVGGALAIALDCWVNR